MYEPFVIRIGQKSQTFRLEAGNHRIQLMYRNGVEQVPVTVQVRYDCGPHLPDVMTDATHVFEAQDGFLQPEYEEEYVRPSDVFPALKRNEQFVQ